MEEEIALYLDSAEEDMKAAVEHTSKNFAKIRAGRAMPSMLNGLRVDYYGSQTPIDQTANITAPDARTIMIKPWEKNMLKEIEKSVRDSDLGVNPVNDGEVIRITLPQLSGDRRKELVKQANKEAEAGRVSVRNARKEANDGLKALQKDGASEDSVKRAEEKVQALTNQYVKKVDELFEAKEQDIMKV